MLKIGIIFGGNSREREVSFAGGRTVYDNLNKSLFEAIPVFVDSFGNFVLLNWQYIYKGSIRDFYPPVEFLPPSPNEFQVYAESLDDLSYEKQMELITKIGKHIKTEELKGLMDFAFLCLHGTNGEDGRIQGLLEYMHIPYSGSGILPSAIGMNKAIQKEFMVSAGFNSPDYCIIERSSWNKNTVQTYQEEVSGKIKLPYVVKAANQGSSIGLSIVNESSLAAFEKAVNKSFFLRVLEKQEWQSFSKEEKVAYVRMLTDIREGIGLPINICTEDKETKTYYHPEKLLVAINTHFEKHPSPLTLSGFDAESEVMAESFIDGKEFSCIVVEGTNGEPLALPPTEILKGKEVFDYRSKYLPGLSRKITPIALPYENIEQIRKDCERLYKALHFNVYARIDGFITAEGKIFLNDPNTTSGMMPSSFFFHQAAEIGLNPSQFLTYIIRTSLKQRITDFKDYHTLPLLLQKFDDNIEDLRSAATQKRRIAVIFGGYSSERHISVESGRNIYEKLASSDKYEPIPVFLTGNEKEHQLYQVPINLMLKDNADDIKEKIAHYQVHPIIQQIITECGGITNKYSSASNLNKPELLSYEQLAERADGVFIALHGRPGEDGVVQMHLERVGLPYNGSGTYSSQLTINKYETNEQFMHNGLKAAKHAVFTKQDWLNDKEDFYTRITEGFPYPFIAKPVDDGCSAAVKKIKTKEELKAFSEEIFREGEELLPTASNTLHLRPKEEFPRKQVFLVEELISKQDAKHFLEVTGGILTRYDEKGQLQYEVFEASETLSEGDILSLEEKFLAGQGQNITPARYAKSPVDRAYISAQVKKELEKAARLVNVEGYARIDAFVRVYEDNNTEVIFVEVNSLPGMTPATCIFHQSAINGYKPYDFIDKILDFGFKRKEKQMQTTAA